jgi:hypothetical protein
LLRLFKNVRPAEWLLFAFTLGATLAGLFIWLFDPLAFEQVYVSEDGPIESATVFFLMAGAGLCFSRAWNVMRKSKKKEGTFLITAGVLLLLAAGEELSWGQHMFDFHSPGFFNRHNTQGETNIHNLELGGIRLNKIVFADLMGLFVFSYLVLLPWLYRKSGVILRMANNYGICIPQWRHALVLIAVLLLGEAIRSERRSELDELTAVLIFLGTIPFPFNTKDLPDASGK